MIRRAFTLIELLVVVAIIGILVSIILPSMVKAKAQAYEVKCRSNQHQICLALEIYTSENRGWYPLSPNEMNPQLDLMKALKAEDSGLTSALYCPQADVVEHAAQNTTDYPPVGAGTSIIDTPENRAAGNISYLYWSFKDRSAWRATNHKKFDETMDSFRPRHLRSHGLPVPFPVTTDPLTPVALQTYRRGEFWVLSDFFRQGAPFPHTREHKSGLNVLYRDGSNDWMFGQPRANFK